MANRLYKRSFNERRKINSKKTKMRIRILQLLIDSEPDDIKIFAIIFNKDVAEFDGDRTYYIDVNDTNSDELNCLQSEFKRLVQDGYIHSRTSPDEMQSRKCHSFTRVPGISDPHQLVAHNVRVTLNGNQLLNELKHPYKTFIKKNIGVSTGVIIGYVANFDIVKEYFANLIKICCKF